MAGQIGGEAAGQTGGSNELQYSKNNINISEFLKFASQMPSLPLNAAFNFALLFSSSSFTEDNLLTFFFANEMTEWNAYSKGTLEKLPPL